MEELDALLFSHNGILNRSSLDGEVRDILEHVYLVLVEEINLWIERGALGSNDFSRRTKFDLLNDEATSSFVCKNSDGYFIGMTAGLVLSVLDVFMAVMSHPEVFPEIGDSTTELKLEMPFPKTRLIRFEIFRREPATDLSNVGFWRIPIDPQRQEWAVWLMQDALRFVIYHEFAHIFRGHLLLSKNITNKFYLYEDDYNSELMATASQQTSSEQSITILDLLQTFELDADIMAVLSTLFTETKIDRISRCMFAIGVLFLMRAPAGNIQFFAKTNYPHPSVRFWVVMEYTFKIAAKELGISEENTIEALQERFSSTVNSLTVALNTIFPMHLLSEEIAFYKKERIEFYRRLSNIVELLGNKPKNA